MKPPVAPNGDILVKMIGRSLEDPEVQFLLRSIVDERGVSDLDDELAVEAPERGLAFRFDERMRLSSVFFHGRGPPYAAAVFVGSLPRGLTFARSRAAVHAQLGKPSVASEVFASPINREPLCWDRYDWPEVSLHLQYGADAAQIHLVTLMAPWCVAGLGRER